MANSVKRGKIKWFDASKGYGFAEDDQKKLIFFHFTAIDKSKQLKDFDSGDEVEFETEKDGDVIRATSIRPIEV